MADDKSNPEPLDEDKPPLIDHVAGAAAIQEVSEAMAILTTKQSSCLVRLAKYGGLPLALLAVLAYWNTIRSPRLKISKATTYITEPRTIDGAQVDYFATFEREFYSGKMKIEDNGYRLIVAALGHAADDATERAFSGEFYEKLGLDPKTAPTLSYTETYDFLHDYCAAEGLGQKQADEWDARVFYAPWTFDDLPMLEKWHEENTAVLDLVAKAVRHPAYRFPIIRTSEDATLVKTTQWWGEIQRTRSFARMLDARACYRIGIGDLDGAIDDVITCARLGRHTAHQGTILGRLVGIAVEGVAASIGVAALQESSASLEQLRRLIDELDALPPQPSWDRTLLAERYHALDFFQAMAHGEESLAELKEWGIIEINANNTVMKLPVDWNIAMRRINELYEDFDAGNPWPSPNLQSPINFLIGPRSRRVAELFASRSMPAFEASFEANRRMNCVHNLQRITLALLLYEREHGTLPPSYTVDAAGNPLHSWRVLLLPYLGQAELWGNIRLDEPWDSEHNSQFHDVDVSRYRCLSCKLRPGQTSYSVVVGDKTAFQEGEGKSLDDFGPHLMLVVEREQPVCWMDPVSELTQSIAFEGIVDKLDDSGYGIGSPHPGGVIVGFRNGGVTFISNAIEVSKLHGLLDGTQKTRDW